MPTWEERFPYASQLAMPVIGLEAEFRVLIDDQETAPEDVWRTPAGFIGRPLLKRTNKSMQLPTGGALYFDGGVLEVVTPVIELAPQCTARVVRSLWEQIDFVRRELDAWESRSGRQVRLQAFSCHMNISFELTREERGRNRTIQKLALILAHLLPIPLIVIAENRRSTGIGVRPRRERVEITLDFTPDPGLMAATVALVVGVTREVIAWPNYRTAEIDRRHIPRIAGITPGKHATRKGWLTRDFHFPRNPFKTGVDARVWKTIAGDKASLREVAFGVAMMFRDSIRRYADPFAYRLLFSILNGETPSLLDLPDRPPAYDDIGRSIRLDSVLPELRRFVRTKSRQGAPGLTRSAYESVFLKLGARSPLIIGDEILTPVKVKGWYHSIFQTPAGEERMLSIDQLRLLGY